MPPALSADAASALAPSPPPSHRQTTLLGLLLLTLVLLFAWQSWRADREDQLHNLRTVAELAERGTDRFFLQQQRALSELALGLMQDGQLAEAPALHDRLRAFKERHDELQGVHLLALDGSYLGSSATPDVAQLPSVQAQRNFEQIVASLRPEQPMELARPLLGPVSQRWILPLRLVVRDRQGQPVGFLVAAAPVELVQTFWSDAPVVRDAALALMRDDGYLINRYPLPEGVSDDAAYRAPRTGALIEHLRTHGFPRRGTVEGRSSIAEQDNATAFVRLSSFPVTMLVTMPRQRMLLNWWDRAAGPLLLTATLAALGLLSFHHLRQREHAWARERQRTEVRLRESEALLQRTGQVARIGGWRIDTATRALTASAGLYRILEIDDHEPLDITRGLGFFPEQARADMAAALERSLDDGSSLDLELPFVSASGRALWVRVVGEAEFEGGRPVRLAGALQDVTEYRQRRVELQQEQALRQRAEQQARELDTLLAERGEMLDVLAHEVRQPLNNASAAMQSASAAVREVGNAAVASRLARAHAVMSQVTGSIDNTLAVATQLARPGPIRREDTDIDMLLATAIADLPAEQRGRVTVERQTATRTVLADMSLVRLALRNLLVNALRHGPGTTPVTVRISDSDEPLALMIDVIDRGPGIEPGVEARLFERGSRGSGSGGHGLGLFIVRRVMEQHGGNVLLLSKRPGEVVFRLVMEQTADD